MNPIVRKIIPNELSAVYALIENELCLLDETMKRELSSTDPFVNELTRYAFELGGKRLRPVLVFLSARAVGHVAEAHCLVAASLEMTHTATLIHDDILDGATVRRHLATMNVRWDNQTGVLAGDLLFTVAMELVTRLEDVAGYRMLAEAVQKTCRGELRQVGARNRFDLTEGEYLDILGEKTAALLGCCCRLGAYFAGADPETVARYYQFGFQLGLAFQIADDILDLAGEERTVGKTLGTDLLNRKATLPLIHYLHTASPVQRQKMLDLATEEEMTPATIAEIIACLEKNGSIEAARRKADQMIDEALEILPGEGDREASDSLRTIARYVVERKK